MLAIKLSSVKGKIKVDEEKVRAAYAQIKEIQQKEAQLKETYKEQGLEKPEVMA